MHSPSMPWLPDNNTANLAVTTRGLRTPYATEQRIKTKPSTNHLRPGLLLTRFFHDCETLQQASGSCAFCNLLQSGTRILSVLNLAITCLSTSGQTASFHFAILARDTELLANIHIYKLHRLQDPIPFVLTVTSVNALAVNNNRPKISRSTTKKPAHWTMVHRRILQAVVRIAVHRQHDYRVSQLDGTNKPQKRDRKFKK